MDVTSLVFIDSAGFHVADFPSFLSFVQTAYKGIYGADVYLGADSIDGQWTTLQAQMLYDTAMLAAAVYNSLSPVSAQGTGLSRIVKINGLNRDVPTFSTVVLTVVGVAGTVLTSCIAVDILNQQWALPATVTIPSGGSINVTATATVQGSINALANTITGIFTPALGWQTVNNAASATAGSPVETDSQLRARQIVSVANPSLTVLDGTYGSVANVPGVTNVAVWENFTGSTDANGQPAHSISVVVNGGDLTAVARAIQIHKTPGTNPWSGPTHSGHNQTVILPDSRGVPVSIGFFQPPLTAEIGVQVTLVTGAGWTTAFEPIIAAQVASYINSLGIGAGAQFGGLVQVIPLYPLLFVPGYVSSMYVISSVEIQLNGGGFSSSPISINEISLPTCVPASDVVFVV